MTDYALLMLDPDGRIVTWNAGAKCLFGSEAQEVIGLHFSRFCTPEDTQSGHIARVLKAAQTHGHCEDGWQIHKDGQRLWTHRAFAPIKDAGSEFRGFSLVIRDISEQQSVNVLAQYSRTLEAQAEEMAETNAMLQQASHRFQELFQGLPIPCFCYDAHGRIFEWNRACESVYGWRTEQVLQKPFYDLLCPPERKAWARECIERVFAGEALDGLEWIHEHGDGARRFMLGNAFPLRGADGLIVGAISASVDITARRRAEDAARQAHEDMELRIQERTQELADANGALQQEVAERHEAELELQRVLVQSEQLLASISYILIGVDGKGLITAWNAAAQRCFGKATSDVLGQPFSECAVSWERERVLHGAALAKDDDEVVRLDNVRYTCLDGKECFLSMSLNPINGFMCEATGFMLLATDITEQRILESQLAQAQKLESIGQLAAGIAHEINTPIQYLGDNTRFLQDSFTDLRGVLAAYARLTDRVRTGEAVPPDLIAEIEASVQAADVEYLLDEIPQAIRQSLEGVERVTHIVRAMKEFSHPGTTQKTAIDLNHALESTLTVARNEWKYVADALTDFDPHLPLVLCLPADLNQVFLNIIINASHAIADVVGDGTNGKGTLRVSTLTVGDWVEVRIADSGTGIPEAIRSRIFDPFFTTKEVGRGTGQGLAISHAVVAEKHGGNITLESEMGRGTTFIIRLPVHMAEEELDANALNSGLQKAAA